MSRVLVPVCVAAVLAQAVPVRAQPEPAEDKTRFRFLASAEWQYGTPLRNAAGAALFIPNGNGRCEDGICVWPGFQAAAQVGAGGWRVGAGPAWGPLFGADVLVTATRTSSAPRGASERSTYLGLEGGFQLLFLRSSLGVARRVAGPSGPGRTIVTWNVGVRVPIGPY